MFRYQSRSRAAETRLYNNVLFWFLLFMDLYLGIGFVGLSSGLFSLPARTSLIIVQLVFAILTHINNHHYKIASRTSWIIYFQVFLQLIGVSILRVVMPVRILIGFVSWTTVGLQIIASFTALWTRIEASEKLTPLIEQEKREKNESSDQ